LYFSSDWQTATQFNKFLLVNSLEIQLFIFLVIPNFSVVSQLLSVKLIIAFQSVVLKYADLMWLYSKFGNNPFWFGELSGHYLPNCYNHNITVQTNAHMYHNLWLSHNIQRIFHAALPLVLTLSEKNIKCVFWSSIWSTVAMLKI